MVGKLIYICGPDGVGKSTQAKLLIENLKKEDIVFEYRWLRFYHFFSLPLLGIARLMGLSHVKTLDNSEKIGYHYFYKSKFVSFFYPILLLIDSILLTLIRVYIPNHIFNKNIVCDRFIYDTVIDIMISTGDYNFHKSFIGRRYFGLIPDNSKIVMLNTDEATLRLRRNDVMHDKTLGLKIMLYSELATKFGIPVLNANSSPNRLNLEIRRNLDE